MIRLLKRMVCRIRGHRWSGVIDRVQIHPVFSDNLDNYPPVLACGRCGYQKESNYDEIEQETGFIVRL